MARKKIYRKNSSNGLYNTYLVIPTSSDLDKLDHIEYGAQKNPKLAPVATSGSYNDLSNKPALAPVATTGSYNSLNDKPSLAKVATSGSYGDLINTPTKADVTSLLGFGNYIDTHTWGTVTSGNGYRIVWGADQSNGGSIAFGEKDGQTSFQVDGDIYVHEGSERLLASSDIANGFYLNPQSQINWNDSGHWTNNNQGVTYPWDYGGLHWRGQSDGIDLFARERDSNQLDLIFKLTDDNSNAIRVLDAYDNNTLTITPDGSIYSSGSISVGGTINVGNKTVLTDHQSIKMLKTDNADPQATSASESITGSGTINLHKVSKTGNYYDLKNRPSINNGELIIQKNGTDVASFTANSDKHVIANITIPTKVSELVNDSGYVAGVTHVGSGDTINILTIDPSTKVLTATRNSWSMSAVQDYHGSYSADNNSDHMIYSSSATSKGHGHGCLVMAHGHITSQAGYINITDTYTFYTDYDSYAIQAGEEAYWGSSWVTATAYLEKGKTAYVHAKGVEKIYIICVYF